MIIKNGSKNPKLKKIKFPEKSKIQKNITQRDKNDMKTPVIETFKCSDNEGQV